MTLPGRFGPYGGKYVPETLMTPLAELETAWKKAMGDNRFRLELDSLLRDFAGRPTPITLTRGLTAAVGGPKIWLKREDLLHTGAHKINNAIGQGLLTKRMGKSRVVAETGAGQHGVAAATACALLGLECVVYMGSVDMARQSMNVYRMRLLGAKVVPVDGGTRTLKDAINEAMRDWVTNVRTTHYILGSVLGPHPFPSMVRDFHAVIGREARKQLLRATGRLPRACVACVGGGSNAIGLFGAFLRDKNVALIGVEAGGRGTGPGEHAARFGGTGSAAVGILHGTKTFILQDEAGQVLPTHSISAGLDYPAIGPEHAQLHDCGRVLYESATDEETLRAFHILAEKDGILPALESAHAIAWVLLEGKKRFPNGDILINLSGRGDKDLRTVAMESGLEAVE